MYFNGAEVLEGGAGRAGWVDRKIDANICLFKKELFQKVRFRIVLCFKHLKTFYWGSALSDR